MEDLVVVLIVILGIVVLCALLFGGLVLFDVKVRCPNFGEAVELESKYVVFGGGCFVKTETGQWVKAANYWNSPINNQ